MRFLTDESVARSTVSLLRSLGHDVLDVRESGMAGSPDADVMARAKAEGRTVVTMDKDFGDLLAFDPSCHAGAIVLRLRIVSPTNANSLLSVFLANVSADQVERRLVILTERGFRSRAL